MKQWRQLKLEGPLRVNKTDAPQAVKNTTCKTHGICEHVERNSISKSTNELYLGVIKLTIKSCPNIHTIKKSDGENILPEAKDVKNRWKEYCSKLYKKNVTVTSPPFHAEHPCPEEPKLLISAAQRTINLLKLNKST